MRPFWRHLWPIAAQTHGTTEAICWSDNLYSAFEISSSIIEKEREWQPRLFCILCLFVFYLFVNLFFNQVLEQLEQWNFFTNFQVKALRDWKSSSKLTSLVTGAPPAFNTINPGLLVFRKEFWEMLNWVTCRQSGKRIQTNYRHFTRRMPKLSKKKKEGIYVVVSVQ